MPEGLLTVLKFCFLALLYLFLFRVVRIVRLELKPTKVAVPVAPAGPEPMAAPVGKPAKEKKTRGGAGMLRVLDPPLHAGEIYAVDDEVTVGRAPGCGIVLEEDTFVSQVHARLFRRGRETYVEDLGSTNGTMVNGVRIDEVTRLSKGDQVQFGNTLAEITGEGMKLVPGGATDQGQVRDSNEDGYVVDRRLQLFAIADGMGGHRAGEVASATALEALRASVASGTGIGDAITSANAAVFSKATDDDSLSGMGTTLTALVPDADGVLVGHVGDSRAYLLRDGELRQLTTDHSLVQEFIREGRLTEEQAAVHPQRSIITRALGVEPDVEVDVYPVRLRAGDRLLLCSDGLSTMLRNADIAGLLRRESDPTRAANLLVDAANAAGGEDNITTIVVDVEDDGADPFAPAPASVSPSVTTATPAALVGTEAERAAGTPPGRSDVDDATAAIPITQLPDGGKSMGVGAVAPDAATGAAPDATRAQTAVPVTEAPAKAKAGDLDLPEGATAAQALAARERAERKQERHPVRSAGRFARFIVPILLILGLAIGVTAWYARRTYYVDFDHQGRVTVYQGRPGGLLLWDPTVVQHTKITKADLPEDARVDVADRKEFTDQGAATAFVTRIEDRAAATASTTTTTTTPGAATSTTTTTTP